MVLVRHHEGSTLTSTRRGETHVRTILTHIFLFLRLIHFVFHQFLSDQHFLRRLPQRYNFEGIERVSASPVLRHKRFDFLPHPPLVRIQDPTGVHRLLLVIAILKLPRIRTEEIIQIILFVNDDATIRELNQAELPLAEDRLKTCRINEF